MILIPKEKPAIENLNSFYLDINKMIEHYQGELGTGCIHFKSSSDEGLIFFDKDDLLNGIFKTPKGETKGDFTIDLIIKSSAGQNFNIDIYKIDQDKVYFWANIPFAKQIYKNLSTEFTDLERLINKMSSEKLTGYIDVSINKGQEGGFIFFSSGELLGGSYSWEKGGLNTSKKNMEVLFQKTNSKGGNFNVCSIPLAPGKTKGKVRKPVKKPAGKPVPVRPYGIIEELLIVFENLLTAQKNLRMDYNTILKRKFVEKVDKYNFLDPFAAEFKYADKKITYTGESTKKEVVMGVVECVRELANDLKLNKNLIDQLKPWHKKYAKEIKAFDIRL